MRLGLPLLVALGISDDVVVDVGVVVVVIVVVVLITPDVILV